MKKIRISNWKQDESESILFAVQRLDEMLFYYTQDTYKANIYNTKMLLEEYLEVNGKIEMNLLDKKNDQPILEELRWSLKKDKEAISLIGLDVYEEFEKEIGGMGTRERIKCVRYMLSCLEGSLYFEKIKQNLREAINIGKKKEIDRLLQQFVCEAKNCGYKNRYIHKNMNKYFCTQKQVSEETVVEFLNEFDCCFKKYTVYVVVDEELAKICVHLMNLLQDAEVEVVQDGQVPTIVKKNVASKVIRLKDIEALDQYSALDLANKILKIMAHFYSFYRHNIKVRISGGYVESEDMKLQYIRPDIEGIKKSAKVSSQSNSMSAANDLFFVSMTNPYNFYILTRIMEIHNVALEMDSASNSLLDLWSILELLLEKEDEEKGKSRIVQIVNMLEPFIKNSYIDQMVQTFESDLKHWSYRQYNMILSRIEEGSNNKEKVFAFIALEKYDELRKEIYKQLNDYPLLRYRIFCLNDIFKKSKNIKEMILEHEQKTTWQIYRIYRSRNCIIHDGEQIENIDELVENLHYYIDMLGRGIVKLLSNREASYKLVDTIYEMYMIEKMFIKMLEHEDINEQNFLRIINR